MPVQPAPSPPTCDECAELARRFPDRPVLCLQHWGATRWRLPAPAPVPGETAHQTLTRLYADAPAALTVEDVLGVLGRAVKDADDYHPVSWRVGGEDIRCCWHLRREGGVYTLTNALTDETVSSGSLRSLLMSQKARGLL